MLNLLTTHLMERISYCAVVDGNRTNRSQMTRKCYWKLFLINCSSSIFHLMDKGNSNMESIRFKSHCFKNHDMVCAKFTNSCCKILEAIRKSQRINVHDNPNTMSNRMSESGREKNRTQNSTHSCSLCFNVIIAFIAIDAIIKF